MSRNEEKAKASLNRWRQYSSSTARPSGDTRSHKRLLASECTSLIECESTRKRLVEQISTKVEEIQRVVPDDNCKKLNDEINKLFKIKGHWERQIRALGGPDYRQDKQNSSGGYMYFGAARELPEVKALLKKKDADSLVTGAIGNVEKTVIDPSQLTHEYYGFDESDLITLEAEAETRARKAVLEVSTTPSLQDEQLHWSESWAIPGKEDVDRALLDYKKAELLRKYAS